MKEVIIIFNNPINLALLFIFIIAVLVMIKKIGGLKTKWFSITPQKSACNGKADCQYFAPYFEIETMRKQDGKMRDYFLQLNKFYFEHVYKDIYYRNNPQGEIVKEKDFRIYAGMVIVFKYDCYQELIQTALKENGFVKIYNQKYVFDYLEKKCNLLFTHIIDWFDLNYHEYAINDNITTRMITESMNNLAPIFYELTRTFFVECIIITLRQETIRGELIAGHSYPDEKKIEQLFEKQWKMTPKRMYDKFTKQKKEGENE